MKKDIFIDTNIASRFQNPADPEYIKLIKWLLSYQKVEEGEEDTINAHLVVSKKLLGEYNRSNYDSKSNQNIITIISVLTKQGRIPPRSKQDIDNFKRKYFTKRNVNKLTCNQEDREHIPFILLSDRKYALAIDGPLVNDLLNFPKFRVLACKRPKDLPYDK